MTDFHIEKIADRCAGFGVEIDGNITGRLNLYGNLLLEWNEKMKSYRNYRARGRAV